MKKMFDCEGFRIKNSGELKLTGKIEANTHSFQWNPEEFEVQEIDLKKGCLILKRVDKNESA